MERRMDKHACHPPFQMVIHQNFEGVTTGKVAPQNRKQQHWKL